MNAAQKALGADPANGLDAVRQLRQELERAEKAQVSNALAAGWTWARIGRALGVSRQAVHRKFSSCKPVPLIPTIPLISGSVRVALVLARTEASARGDVLVGTEHLLLGLLQQGEGRAARALREAGAQLRLLRSVADVQSPQDLSSVPPSQIGMTSRAATALDLAAMLAQRGGEKRMGDHHILAALLRDPDSGAVALLRGSHVDPFEVLEALGRPSDDGDRATAAGEPSAAF